MDSEDEREAHHVPPQLFFSWNMSAIASFIRKLNGMNKKDMYFPATLRQFEDSFQGCNDFTYAFIEYLSRNIPEMEICGEYQVMHVTGKHFGTLTMLITSLQGLTDEPWLQAVLRDGEALPGKLVKITTLVRGKDENVTVRDHPLFH